MTMRATLRRLKRRLAPSGSGVNGKLDGLDDQGLFGWAVVDGRPAGVEIRSGDQVVMTAATGLPRPDVAAAGVGPLHCGFRFGLASLPTDAARAMAASAGEPLRLVVEGVELDSPLEALSPEQLVEAEALAWVSRKARA